MLRRKALRRAGFRPSMTRLTRTRMTRAPKPDSRSIVPQDVQDVVRLRDGARCRRCGVSVVNYHVRRAQQGPAEHVPARERSGFGQFQLRPSHLTTGPNPHSPGSPERKAFDARRDAWRTRHTFRPDEADAARLTVCEWATGVADARALMDALGILPAVAALSGEGA